MKLYENQYGEKTHQFSFLCNEETNNLLRLVVANEKSSISKVCNHFVETGLLQHQNKVFTML